MTSATRSDNKMHRCQRCGRISWAADGSLALCSLPSRESGVTRWRGEVPENVELCNGFLRQLSHDEAVAVLARQLEREENGTRGHYSFHGRRT